MRAIGRRRVNLTPRIGPHDCPSRSRKKENKMHSNSDCFSQLQNALSRFEFLTNRKRFSDSENQKIRKTTDQTNSNVRKINRRTNLRMQPREADASHGA